MSGIAILVGLAAMMVYAALRSMQHRELSRAYEFAHEQCHDTDRGYFPDEFTGLDELTVSKIGARFREVEQKWWMFGKCRERARSEVRMASWLVMHMREAA